MFRYAHDARLAEIMDSEWQRVSSGGASRDRDRSGMPTTGHTPPQGMGYGSYQQNNPGAENTWQQGTISNERCAKPVLADGTKVYFAVTFDEKDEAKGMGARWDKESRCWFAEDPGAIAALEGRFKRRGAA
jgi:hypothetical protein